MGIEGYVCPMCGTRTLEYESDSGVNTSCKGERVWLCTYSCSKCNAEVLMNPDFDFKFGRYF